MSFTDIVYSFKDSIRVLFNSCFIPEFKKQGQVKNKSILILGNGPSARDYLGVIKSNDKTEVFALNDFSISPFFQKICPKYYIFLDPAYWIPASQTNDYDVEIREKIMNSLKDDVKWDMTVFIPKRVDKQRLIPELYENPNITVVPFNDFYVTLRRSNFFFKCLEKNFATPFNNVLAAAIYLSINMGYKQIGVIGADHSWTIDLRVNNINQVCTIRRHSYGEEEQLIPWLTSKGEPQRMHLVMGDLSRAFYSYHLLREYAEAHGVHIINHSMDSFIDAFDKAPLIIN